MKLWTIKPLLLIFVSCVVAVNMFFIQEVLHLTHVLRHYLGCTERRKQEDMGQERRPGKLEQWLYACILQRNKHFFVFLLKYLTITLMWSSPGKTQLLREARQTQWHHFTGNLNSVTCWRVVWCPAWTQQHVRRLCPCCKTEKLPYY